MRLRPGHLALAAIALMQACRDKPTEPVVVPFPAASIYAGFGHTCALTSAGAAVCWGANDSGQVGDATFLQRPGPVTVIGGLTFQSLALGERHTCGLTSGGAAHCWGSNRKVQLGDSDKVGRASVPTPVVGGQTFTGLAAGATHTCALIAGGAAYCWGSNHVGELGGGDTAAKSVPTPVSGGLTFTQIVAGSSVTCGLTAAGAAHCWGWNTAGEIGDGTLIDRTTPVAVSGAHVFQSLVAGAVHVCGLTAAGAAWCWGSGEFGQTGEASASLSPRVVPVAVGGAHVFTSLTAGAFHTCGLAAGGVAFCWGSDEEGQVGDGAAASTNVFSPVLVSGGIAFTSLAAGGAHTCGVSTAGLAYCWGNNFFQQLGDGGIPSRSSPAPVKTP